MLTGLLQSLDSLIHSNSLASLRKLTRLNHLLRGLLRFTMPRARLSFHRLHRGLIRRIQRRRRVLPSSAHRFLLVSLQDAIPFKEARHWLLSRLQRTNSKKAISSRRSEEIKNGMIHNEGAFGSIFDSLARSS